MVAAVGDTWGEWLIDDLAVAGRSASHLVGASEPVSQLRVLRPDESYRAVSPTVVIVVPEPDIANRMRNRLLKGEYVVDFYEPLFGDSWQAEVNGLVIRIEMESV